MTRLIRITLWTVTAVMFLSAPSAASPFARPFISGLEAYQAGRYDQAIAQWKAIAHDGVVNGQLFYNLGNAYLKADRLGPAILWYERARHLLPNDPDLRFNLEYARTLTKDTPAENASPLVRILFFWRYRLNAEAINFAAIFGNLLFWVLLIAWRLAKRRGLFRAAVIVAAPSLVFILTAAYNYGEAHRAPQAIILPDQVSVRSGRHATDTELFVLHAGAKIEVVKHLNSHYQIRYSADKIGWVEQDAVGLIDTARWPSGN
jgi:tetratricopeptide (TPR) repeat protein